jgi:hypothetical protein
MYAIENIFGNWETHTPSFSSLTLVRSESLCFKRIFKTFGAIDRSIIQQFYSCTIDLFMKLIDRYVLKIDFIPASVLKIAIDEFGFYHNRQRGHRSRMYAIESSIGNLGTTTRSLGNSTLVRSRFLCG